MIKSILRSIVTLETIENIASRVSGLFLIALSVIAISEVCHCDEVDYIKDIKPLLKERCFACHGGLKQEAGLRLDTADSIKAGGDSGEAISPGVDVAKSLLLKRVSEQDESLRMPPLHEGEALSAEQIEKIRKWIENGAVGFVDERPESSPGDHWSFRPLVKPELPAAADSNWIRNPIDVWIAKGHEKNGLRPQGEASRELLLRRLTVDLIGIVPTAEEISAFENDESSDWYEKAVERLLEDPRHGERWARHWMDNWRYSDWWGLGEDLRNSQRHIWHWRDWVVESLNSDVPYDEMIRQMLAADEIYPNDVNKLRATGFLARNYFIFNRNQWLDETVEHVSKSLLGLTMNCAKCHNHKFDPISQVDYYAMRAFFEPYQVRTDLVANQTTTLNDGIPRVFDGKLDTPTYLFVRGNEAQPDKSRVIAPDVPEYLSSKPLQICEVKLPAEAYEPQRKPGVIDAFIAEGKQKVKEAEAELQVASEKLVAAKTLLQSLKDRPDAVRNNVAAYEDNFAMLDAVRWKALNGEWKHEAGKVEQSKDGPEESELAYLGEMPADFEATLKFRIRGGSTWRSVGLAFDVQQEATQDEVKEYWVYVSGASGQSKVQVSYKFGNAWQYPADGAKAMTIDLDRDYTLRVQIRDSLINVYLDEERVVAWRSSKSRRGGALQVVTFDALASMQGFKIEQLANETGLHDPALNESVFGDPTIAAEKNVQSMQQELLQAELKRTICESELESISKRAAAFGALWNGAEDATLSHTHSEAVKAERALVVAKAKQVTFQANQKLNQASSQTREAEKKKFDDAVIAQQAAETALQADVLPSDVVTPFVGAKWSATRFLNTTKDDDTVTFPATSTGRRKALAEWITSSDNPLAARVAVNHIWARHLDQPLAGSTFDLGRNAPSPTNPELIDWLASELIQHNWSMKHIHRLIVNSATYRMSSSVLDAQEILKKDPDNRYWWRRTPIRLEAEVVRDSLLAMSGSLETKLGGPPVMPADQESSKRRSLYFFHSNNERNMFLTTFDEALVTECYRREQSIVPQQALALSNSSLAIDASRDIAAKISSASKDDRDFAKHAFKLVLGMTASEEEVATVSEAMKHLLAQGNSSDQVRANIVWALLNHNDFVTLR